MSQRMMWGGGVVDNRCCLLVVEQGGVTYAELKRRDYNRCLAELEAGGAVAVVLKNPKMRVAVDRIVAVEHQRNTSFVALMHLDKQDKKATTGCQVNDNQTAAEVARALAAAAGLSATHAEPASLKAITVGPAIGVGVFLTVLGLMLAYAANADPNAAHRPAYSRVARAKEMALWLGPHNLLLIMAAVLVIGAGYWLYRCRYRPLVDVYQRAQPQPGEME